MTQMGLHVRLFIVNYIHKEPEKFIAFALGPLFKS